MLKCTVSELNKQIRILYDDKLTKNIEVTGEICSVNARSGTYWVGLKDDMSYLNCAFWRQTEFEYEEGEKVTIIGSVQFYEKSSRTTFIGRSIKRIGEGELHKQYKKNYKFLKDNNYFSKSGVPIPEKLESIGILTSKNGDAVNDIVRALKDNNYGGNIYIYDCTVQGNRCPNSVINGIKYFNESDLNIDVIVLTRGGGSQEDLMGFSDIDLVKEIYNSNIYTISAIGHEADKMLSDYVANHRSPTPSLAGRDISERYNVNRDFLTSVDAYLDKKVANDISLVRIMMEKLCGLTDRLPDMVESIDWEIKDLSNLDNRYYHTIKGHVTSCQNKLEYLKEKLKENSYDHILEKGYCLLLTRDGKIVNDIEKIRKDKKLKLYINGKQVNILLTIDDE